MTQPDGLVPAGSVAATGLAALAAKTQEDWETQLYSGVNTKLDPLSQLFNIITKAFLDTAETVIGWFSNAVDLQGWLDVLDDVISFFYNLLDRSGFLGVMQDIVDFFAEITDLSTWMGVFQQVIDFFGGISAGVRDTFLDVFQTVVEFFSDIVDLPTWIGVFEQVVNFFGGIAANVRTNFLTVFKDIVNFFSGAASTLGSNVQTWLGGLFTALKSVWDFFAGIATAAGATAQAWLTDALKYLGWIWQNFGAALDSFLKPVATWLKWLWDNFGAAVDSFLKPVATWLKWVWDNFGSAVESFLKPVFTTIKAVWDFFASAGTRLGSTASALLTNLFGFLNWLWNGAAGGFAGFGATVESILKPVMEFLNWLWVNFGAAVESFLKPVANWLKWVWDNFGAALESFLKPVSLAVKSVWDFFAGIATAAGSTAQTWVTDALKYLGWIWQNFGAALESFLKPVANWLKWLWDNFGAVVESFLKPVFTTIKAVWDFFASAGTRLGTTASSLLTGLFSFLSWAWNGVANGFAGFRDVVDSVLKPIVETLHFIFGTLFAGASQAIQNIFSTFKNLLDPQNTLDDWLRKIPFIGPLVYSLTGKSDEDFDGAPDLGALGVWARKLLAQDSPLNARNLFGTISSALLSIIPVANISATSPNLLSQANFEDGADLTELDGWTWDASNNYTGTGGSAKFLNDATNTLQIASSTVTGATVSVAGGYMIKFSAAPTGGSYTLSYNGSTSSAIAYNASATTVRNALQNMDSIGSGNVTVGWSGTLGSPYSVIIKNPRVLWSTQSIPVAAGDRIKVSAYVQTQSLAGGCQYTVTTSGSGTFTLSFGGYTTSAIAQDATVATVQTQVTGLSSVGSGNAMVTGSAGSYTITINKIGQLTSSSSGVTITPVQDSFPVTLRLTQYNGAAPAFGSENDSTVVIDSAGASTAWTELVGDEQFVIPSGVTSILVSLAVGNGASTGTVWWDDISVTKEGLLGQTLVDRLLDAWRNIWNGFFGTPFDLTGRDVDSITAATTRTRESIAEVRSAVAAADTANANAGNSGRSLFVDFTGYADNPSSLGTLWSQTYPNPGSGTTSGASTYGDGLLGITGGRATWQNGNDGGWTLAENRDGFARYAGQAGDTVTTTTDYQKIGVAFSSSPAADGYNYICGRMDASSTNFIYLKIGWNLCELWKVVSGTHTRLKATSANGFTFKPGATYWLECGRSDVIDGERMIRWFVNGTQIDEYTVGVGATAIGENNRFCGFGMHATWAFGWPASVAAFAYFDNKKAATRGCGIRRYRDATQQSVSASTSGAVLPNGFFNTEDFATEGITYTATGNKFTVAVDGWYAVEQRLCVGEPSTNFSDYFGCALFKYDGVSGLIARGAKSKGEDSIGDASITSLVYLRSGESIQPGYYGSRQFYLEGSGDKATSYFSMTFLGNTKPQQ